MTKPERSTPPSTVYEGITAGDSEDMRCRSLWLAVIQRWLYDLQVGATTETWLSTPGSRAVCEMAGIEHDYLKRRAAQITRLNSIPKGRKAGL